MLHINYYEIGERKLNTYRVRLLLILNGFIYGLIKSISSY